MANFKDDIIPNVVSVNGQVDTDASGGTSLLNDVLSFIQDSIFSLLAVVAIGAFIYIGFMLIKADGNPEELKKAFMHLVHVIIGLFVVGISWVIVKLVSGISF